MSIMVAADARAEMATITAVAFLELKKATFPEWHQMLELFSDVQEQESFRVQLMKVR
jgi:hypothetical protein